MKKTTGKKKKSFIPINIICWIIIPLAIIIMLIMDALKFYTFNTERIIVIGIGVSVTLIPFFSEIHIKDFSFKKDTTKK